jgi:hypothetical protein
MSPKELQKRNERSQNLRVIQVDEDTYYVESSEGKICYRVMFEGDSVSCTCGDFSRGIKADANFRCKHIISVFNSIPNGEIQHGQMLERSKPKLDERFIIKIENKDFVQYAGLLDLGHQKGISQIEVEPIQLPNQDNGNFAICKATIVSKTGESFTDLGDANCQNTNSKVSRHLLRMASTRAIARALRSFTNIGMTCLEELADLSDLAGGGEGNSKGKPKTGGPAVRPIAAKKPSGDKQKEPPPVETKGAVAEQKTQPNAAQEPEKATTGEPMGAPKAESKGNGKPTGEPKMSEAQKRALWNLSRRRGISVEELHRMALETYGMELEYLSTKDASSFIRSLQQAA